MSDEVEFKDHRGVDWYKYACRYTDHEGKDFCMDFWARDSDDAELRAAAVRESFRIEGRMAMVIDAESGSVLADSSVPENTSGVVH